MPRVYDRHWPPFKQPEFTQAVIPISSTTASIVGHRWTLPVLQSSTKSELSTPVKLLVFIGSHSFFAAITGDVLHVIVIETSQKLMLNRNIHW
jgi:hypothetical protein